MNQRLAALYARDARRYSAVVAAALLAGACAISLLWGILAARTFGVDSGRAVIPCAVAMLAAIPAGALATWFVRRDVRMLLGWASGDEPRDDSARAELLDVALRFPLRAGLAVMAAGTLALYPVLLTAFASATALDVQDWVLGVGGGALGTIYLAAWAYGGLELALRPLRSELGATVTRERRGRIRSVSLITKMLIGLAVTAIVLGFVAGVLIANPDSSLWEGVRIVAIAVVVSGIVGGSLALPLAKSSLGPIDDLTEGTRSVAAGHFDARVPLTSTDEFAGLVLSFNEMVEGLAEREALRGHNAELVEELRASQARIVAASNEARRRVERDLHDGAQQNLVLLNLKLGLVEKAVADDQVAQALVAETRAELEQALVELRDLAHGIYPQVLTSDGLAAALSEAVENAPISAAVDSDGTGRYPPELEAAVYFCCLEALQNAAKHAGPGSRARIVLSERGGNLEFVVMDDGAGFEPAANNGSGGLQNMSDRIGALGGKLRIDSSPGTGTRVIGQVPIAAVRDLGGAGS